MQYNITIQGRGGHGSRPDCAINPVDCFAAVYGALQHMNPQITQVEAGHAVNVIPDKLTFRMECSADAQTLNQWLTPICQPYRCSFEISTVL